MIQNTQQCSHGKLKLFLIHSQGSFTVRLTALRVKKKKKRGAMILIEENVCRKMIISPYICECGQISSL